MNIVKRISIVLVFFMSTFFSHASTDTSHKDETVIADSNKLNIPIYIKEAFQAQIRDLGTKAAKEKELIEESRGEWIEKEENSLFTFWLIVLAISLLTIVKLKSENYFGEIFRGLTNRNYVKLLLREGRLTFKFPQVLLDVLFVFVISFLISHYLGLNSPNSFAYIAISVVIIILVKVVSVQLAFKAFFGMSASQTHIAELLLFQRTSVVILLPAVILLYLLPDYFTNSLIWLSGGLIALLFVYYALRMYLTIREYCKSSYLYNFIYLCTIEIMPLLLLLKWYT